MTTPHSAEIGTSLKVAEKACLSTVGIHPVFLHPQDFEIVGELKCKPEDFVVVELGQDGRYAELTDTKTLPVTSIEINKVREFEARAKKCEQFFPRITEEQLANAEGMISGSMLNLFFNIDSL